MKHVTPREGPGNQASTGPADTKARRRRADGRIGAAAAESTPKPSSPPQILADFHPTPEQQAGARKWLVQVLARRAVERLKEQDRKS